MTLASPLDAREVVQEYYGQVLKTQQDLQTGACCSADEMPSYLREIIAEIESEVLEKFLRLRITHPTGIGRNNSSGPGLRHRAGCSHVLETGRTEGARYQS